MAGQAESDVIVLPSTDPADELDSISIRDLLDNDSRPTFVVDLDPDVDAPLSDSSSILPVFSNATLRQHVQLLDMLTGAGAPGLPSPVDKDAASENTYLEFKQWAMGSTTHDDSKDVFPLSFIYGDLLWTGSTVKRRWRIISGNRIWRAEAGLPRDLSSGPLEVATGTSRTGSAPRTLDDTKFSLSSDNAVMMTVLASRNVRRDGSVVTDPETLAGPDITTTERRRPSYYPTPTASTGGRSSSAIQSTSIKLINLDLPPLAGVPDWTVEHPRGILTDHLIFARSVDWSKTPVGPMTEWSPEFRQAANLCMGNPHPAALFWGKDLTMLYNEAYGKEVAGNKHPSLMGTDFSGPFKELWDYAAPVFEQCAKTGISVRKDDDYLTINRHGLLEETYFSWTFTPLYGGTKNIVGFYNAPFETTKQVLNKRRTQTINRIGELSSVAKTIKQFWEAILHGLQDNGHDVPFALLYSVEDSTVEDNELSVDSYGSGMSKKICYLEGSIAVPNGHQAAPVQLDLKRGSGGYVPSFREAMRTREPTLLLTKNNTLPEALLEGIEWRGFGDPCTAAVIFPVRPTNGDTVVAFLVLGVNPRRPYDDEYMAFTRMLNRQLATSLASAMLYEDEVRRGRDLAEAVLIERDQLAQQLDLQSNRLRRMTEQSPIGMFLINNEGVLREANERFYLMTGHCRDVQYELSWMDIVAESSMHTIKTGWHCLIKERQPWTGELQLKKLPIRAPVNLAGEQIEYWVMFVAHPELNADGSTRSIMGSLMDLSHHKWAQGLQNQRILDAEETRRQQNEFIDITSHEMRNPLSAILQCADDILSSLEDYVKANRTPPPEVIESCMSSAHTIELCVQHQKSVVDDILTISKLDSNLLLLTPVPTQPTKIVKQALKMFEPELRAKDIQTILETQPSYEELEVEWVMVDPSRVLQILINLMTNAIKFTASAGIRVITVTVGVSTEPPEGLQISGFQFVPTILSNGASARPLSTNSGWGDGETLYVNFKVEDTGCGLTQKEKNSLFQRFRQASPRTHAQYGGSGLGLFISKRLAELHGGKIGVRSDADKGSTFGFYVEVRRTQAPLSRASTSGFSSMEEEDEAALIKNQHAATLSLAAMPSRSLVDSNARRSKQRGADLAAWAGGARGATTAATPTGKLDRHLIEILVVEDNLINQRILVGQLRKSGYSVNAANDGLEALAFINKTSLRVLGRRNTDPPETGDEADPGVDLDSRSPTTSTLHIPPSFGARKRLSIILMDLEMPNMDGLTCVREIRRMEDSGEIVGRIPVVAVTANVREEHVTQAKEAGMDDVVSKPFKIMDLEEKMRMLLESTGWTPEGVVDMKTERDGEVEEETDVKVEVEAAEDVESENVNSVDERAEKEGTSKDGNTVEEELEEDGQSSGGNEAERSEGGADGEGLDR